MVIWSTLEASCPMCENRVRLREVGSGFALGQDSDLFVRMEGKHIIQAEIHTCHKCHFSGYSPDFMRTLTPLMRKRFLEEVSPFLIDATSIRRDDDEDRPARERLEYARTPLPDTQYYWAFKTAEALALPAVAQGNRLLRAYWCLRLDPSVKLPPARLKALRKLYLKGAIQKLRQGVRHEGDRNLVYLIAELCRRNENFLLAMSYFRRFLEREPGARYLKLAARKLHKAAREGISGEISMEDILYRSPSDTNTREGGEGTSALDVG
jgi:uncharacterized protein (DUF2225 family)